SGYARGVAARQPLVLPAEIVYWFGKKYGRSLFPSEESASENQGAVTPPCLPCTPPAAISAADKGRPKGQQVMVQDRKRGCSLFLCWQCNQHKEQSEYYSCCMQQGNLKCRECFLLRPNEPTGEHYVEEAYTCTAVYMAHTALHLLAERVLEEDPRSAEQAPAGEADGKAEEAAAPIPVLDVTEVLGRAERAQPTEAIRLLNYALLLVGPDGLEPDPEMTAQVQLLRGNVQLAAGDTKEAIVDYLAACSHCPEARRALKRALALQQRAAPKPWGESCVPLLSIPRQLWPWMCRLVHQLVTVWSQVTPPPGGH
ncbi:hypothetical protein CYMTET_25546, partial [Cymbomonas tetramitiformis]